ncbi:MAG: thioredoxin domain-containing protein [Candidatus Marinimicrobia bacterium]|nr:thioredoxin domain-containing protein [Candidatus Neomarinimicrobiota bacterium]
MTHKHTNHLIESSSPYLLQHAHNPVDWYPWGDEAFERAKLEDKPIFLSIGYSTCHWCHVMAHESFEDEAVAQLLNDSYICIKVDREERPDIDQLYMAAATSLMGRGGWPLTIIMSPDKRPFFAGTYFPKESVPGRVGMLQLLPQISTAWINQRTEIDRAADQIINGLQQRKSSGERQALDAEVLLAAATDFKRNYDSIQGGFGSAPKFPSAHNLNFLLREGHRTGDQELTEMAIHSLKQMRLGGIYDQVGFGFHRYSTDASWHVPHFEKMLYDQASLMLAYTEAWEITADPLFLKTMEEILIYLNAKLRAPEGAYYSAEDADSDGEEGKFYVWSWSELQQVLSKAELDAIAPTFGIEPGGNFNDEASRQVSGKNILHVNSAMDYANLLTDPIWLMARQKLYDQREKRVHPGLDDKILCDWNGLMLSALSRAALATGQDPYRKAAADLADYLLAELITKNGTLLHMPLKGEQQIEGFLDDYSFVIQGLRYYYEVSFEPKYLETALKLQEIQIQKFWDIEAGGLFFTADGDQDLFIRQKEIYDGAIPSGNSIAASNLYYLGRLAEKPTWETLAVEIGSSFSDQIRRGPRGSAALLQALQVQIAGSKEIVIAGDSQDLEDALSVIRKNYDPFKLILFRPNKGYAAIEEISGFLAYQKAIGSELTVYICENYACQKPLTSLESLSQALKEYSGK